MLKKLLTALSFLPIIFAGTDCHVVSGTLTLSDNILTSVDGGGSKFCATSCYKDPKCAGWVFNHELDNLKCTLYRGPVESIPNDSKTIVSGVCDIYEDPIYPPPTSDEMAEELKKLRGEVRQLLSNAVNSQMNAEMSTRASGGSGISFSRAGILKKGTQPYIRKGVAGDLGVMNIHNHADHDHTLGIGEFSAVLNGVRFGTRHNDYVMSKLDPEHPECKQCGKPMETPPVPPEVLKQDSVDGQIAEMRQWFKAWQTQDSSVRDYTKYFWPVVVVLEGWWSVIPEDDKLEEPFRSDRHAFEASTFESLHSVNRFLFAGGDKWITENMGWLPSAFIETDQRGQWMYRMSAARLPFDIPLQMFRATDDFGSRFFNGFEHPMTNEEYLESRATRFELANRWPVMDSTHKVEETRERVKDPWIENTMSDLWNPLDDIMYEVFGLDGEYGDIEEISIYDGSPRSRPNGEPLNAARYTRKFSYGASDATGRSSGPRGINDPYLFVAQTTDKNVVKRTGNYKSARANTEDRTLEGRWSYAIPTEIVWLTPLNTWNPHNIKYYGWENVNEPKKGGRSGHLGDDEEKNIERALNGTAYWKYAVTPEEFFESADDAGADPADTSKGAVGVLDQEGNLRRCISSGTYILLPKITGVKSFQGTDRIRTRYPIAPVHEFTSIVSQELKAFADLSTGQSSVRKVGSDFDWRVHTRTSHWMDKMDEHHGITLKFEPEKMGEDDEEHSHSLELSSNDVRTLMREGVLKGLRTSRDGDELLHTHVVNLWVNIHGRVLVGKQTSSKKPEHDHAMRIHKLH